MCQRRLTHHPLYSTLLFGVFESVADDLAIEFLGIHSAADDLVEVFDTNAVLCHGVTVTHGDAAVV